MGRIGVLFLLFYLGLEFSVGRLVKSGRSIVVGGSIYIGINFTLGLLLGFLGGFPVAEALVIAGITTISSSAIVAKVLVDLKRTANPETEMILGITMFEDIFLAVYISILSGFVLSDSSSIGGVLLSALVSLGFMLTIIVLGRKAVPLLNKWLRIRSNELFGLVIFGALFLIAGFSETIHVAEAIGALLVGLVYRDGTRQADRAFDHAVPRLFRSRLFLQLRLIHRSDVAGRECGMACAGCRRHYVRRKFHRGYACG